MNENKVWLLCLIGLPGAGKSYLASAISVNKIGFTRVEHVSFDKLIRWEGYSNEMLWKDKRRAVFGHVEAIIVDFIKEEPDERTLLIILDDNMYYRSMRYEFYRLARKMKSTYCQVFVKTPLEICCERNQSREFSLPTSHIINMNEKLEAPSKNCYWEKYSLTVIGDIEFTSLEAIKDLATRSKELSVAQECTRTTLQCEQSSKHLADIALRKIVSQYIQKITLSQTDNTTARIKQVAEIRREILHSIANGHLSLPNLSTVDAYIDHLTPIFHNTYG